MIYISDPGDYFTIYKIDEKRDIGELVRGAKYTHGKIFWTNSPYEKNNLDKSYGIGWLTDELFKQAHYNCIRDIFQEFKSET